MYRAVVFNFTKLGGHLELNMLVYFIVLINTETHYLLIYDGAQSCSIAYDNLLTK